MIVLGIETTCDETAAAVVVDGSTILSNVVSSQVEIHRKFGGVYPELASRNHVEMFPCVLKEAIEIAGISWKEIDLISVAKGPGLIGPLMVGLNGAKALSISLEKPFVGVNHVEAHLYAAMMTGEPKKFPALGIVLSGGHTFLIKIYDLFHYELIGSTVDDAIGEAFDKVAKLLDLPYPGGPEIEKIAKEGNCPPFKAGNVKTNQYSFSFSGLKTNIFYKIYGQNGTKQGPCPLSFEEKQAVAFAFQEAAFTDVISKAQLAVKQFECRSIYIGGGVSNNRRLRELFRLKMPNLPLFFPPFSLTLDNAAMIAGLGFHVYLQKGADFLDLEPQTRIPL